MRQPTLLLLITLLLCQTVDAKSPFSLVNFKRSKKVAKSSSLLTEENGPWMIFVAAFAGEGAEGEARELVNTLNTKLKVDAYLHKKTYDYTDSVEGKGFDKYGNPKKMRFHSADAFEEFAVLVGDFDTVDDPKLRKNLQQIKYASSEDLGLRGSKSNPTTRRFAGLRSVQKKLTRDKTKQSKGPLALSFATRNPMIPREAVAPQGIEEGLVEINKRVKHTLLKNPGKYTVRVASFRGEVIIDQQKINDINSNKKELAGRINETDDKAEALTRILRDRGIEAYVYHDYHESIVTVGSFTDIGREQPDGTIELNSDVAKVMENYGPRKKPIPGASIKLSGIQPKATRDPKDESKVYVFEVAPQPILVPRKSIATDYLLDSAKERSGGLFGAFK